MSTKNELRVVRRGDARAALPRRLRLPRRDADSCAPTSALTSVDLPTLGRPTIATWPQRNARQPRQIAAALAHRRRRRRPARRRAGSRRLPSRRCRAPGSGRRRRTSAGALRPSRSRSSTRAPAGVRACSHSCRRVFGSLPGSVGSMPASSRSNTPSNRGVARRRSRRRERSRRTPLPARRPGSTAGSRRRFESRPRRVGSPCRDRAASASRCSVSLLTRLARTRESSPSGMRGKRWYSASGDRAIEHAVADEFEALVVIRAEAAVRQRLAQQFRLAKGVTERW